MAQEVAAVRTAFADAGYWMATMDHRDEWHEAATSDTAQLGTVRVVTIRTVAVELLNHMAGP